MLAGFCNSVMDVLDDHFHDSVFSGLNERFWNKAVSWKNHIGKNWLLQTVFIGFTDAWHAFKTAMIISITAAVVFYRPIVSGALDGLLLYLAFTITFEFFYTIVLRKK